MNYKGGISSLKNTCAICRKIFIGRHIRKFCSTKCYHTFRSKYLIGKRSSRWAGGISKQKKQCKECGKHFTGSWKRKYCSNECGRRNLDTKGEKNGRWKGGKYKSKDGYIMVMAKDHPHTTKGYILEHRLKMERKIGRYLKKGEIVHHKNEKKDDNRISNLAIMVKEDHDRYHTTKRHRNGNFIK